MCVQRSLRGSVNTAAAVIMCDCCCANPSTFFLNPNFELEAVPDSEKLATSSWRLAGVTQPDNTDLEC